METKRCNKCGKELPKSEFPPKGWCKACRREYNRIYYAEHREELNARMRARRAAAALKNARDAAEGKVRVCPVCGRALLADKFTPLQNKCKRCEYLSSRDNRLRRYRERKAIQKRFDNGSNQEM